MLNENWFRIGRDIRITLLFVTASVAAGLLVVLLQDIGNRQTAVLWALACFITGGLIGFLFGIPRVLQDSSPRNQPPAGELGANHNGQTAYRMQVNTNLEQISDWLTKIIVGIGLVELRKLPDMVQQLSFFIAGGLGPPPHAQVLAIAMILYFSILGFLSGYLLTRIYLAQAFSRADWGTQNTTISVAGNDLTLEELYGQQKEIINDLQEQVINMQQNLPAAATETLDERIMSGVRQKIRCILWVDDNPKNNSFLIDRLRQLGVDVDISLSTADALAKLDKKQFDQVITDMGRLENGKFNSTAGIALARQIKEKNLNIPVVIFTNAKNASLHKQEAMSADVKLITSSSTRLMKELQIDD